jgi:hypothetical protein
VTSFSSVVGEPVRSTTGTSDTGSVVTRGSVVGVWLAGGSGATVVGGDGDKATGETVLSKESSECRWKIEWLTSSLEKANSCLIT